MQLVASAQTAQHDPHDDSAQREREIRNYPKIRIRIAEQGKLTTLHKRRNNRIVVHAGLLQLEDLRSRRPADVTLAALHVAIQIVVAAAGAFEVDADALHFVAFQLRRSLRNSGCGNRQH